jgi:hypothetical protein
MAAIKRPATAEIVAYAKEDLLVYFYSEIE